MVSDASDDADSISTYDPFRAPEDDGDACVLPHRSAQKEPSYLDLDRCELWEYSSSQEHLPSYEGLLQSAILSHLGRNSTDQDENRQQETGIPFAARMALMDAHKWRSASHAFDGATLHRCFAAAQKPWQHEDSEDASDDDSILLPLEFPLPFEVAQEAILTIPPPPPSRLTLQGQPLDQVMHENEVLVPHCSRSTGTQDRVCATFEDEDVINPDDFVLEQEDEAPVGMPTCQDKWWSFGCMETQPNQQQSRSLRQCSVFAPNPGVRRCFRL